MSRDIYNKMGLNETSDRACLLPEKRSVRKVWRVRDEED